MAHEAERAVIAKFQAQIAKLETEIKSHKTAVNSVCGMMGEEPIYRDIEEASTAGGAMVTRSDEFYGKPLATVVRMILERRKSANLGAVAVPDLHRVMKDGGYLFEAKNDENARRGIHIAMSKNPVFHRLPNGDYGLREWYPAIKDKIARNKLEVVADNTGATDAEGDDEQPLHEELQAAAANGEQAGDKKPAKAK